VPLTAFRARFTSGPYYRRAPTALIPSSMDGRDSVARLTEREKVCLRQWLQHKSAKEIAAELCISHHAVEKRLKMARITRRRRCLSHYFLSSARSFTFAHRLEAALNARFNRPGRMV